MWLESMDEPGNKSREYQEKLLEVLTEVDALRLDDERAYFDQLTKIRGFASLFGYEGPSGETCAIYDLLNSKAWLTFAIKNICYRRTCFYLMKFKESLAEAEGSVNLSKLVYYFQRYRRSEKSYDGDRLRDFLLNLDYIQASALAPLYETFVEPELFTTLLLLETFTRSPSIRKQATKIVSNLLNRLRSILSGYIDDDCGLRESTTHGSQIKDEANIFWGLRILYQEEGDLFNLENRFRGTRDFENLFLSLLNRLNIFDSPHRHRISPKEDDLIFEVTPEIYTVEKTDLYILFNLLELISRKSKFRQNFRAEVGRILNMELERLIVKRPLPDNLYFLSLKYACLTKYMYIPRANSTVHKAPRKPSAISMQVVDRRLVEIKQSVRDDHESIMGKLNSLSNNHVELKQLAFKIQDDIVTISSPSISQSLKVKLTTPASGLLPASVEHEINIDLPSMSQDQLKNRLESWVGLGAHKILSKLKKNGWIKE